MPIAPEAIGENLAVAARFREAAELYREQDANPFRAGAYRRAAETLEQLERPLSRLFDLEGPPGLESLPAVGRGIARAIAEMLVTGRWAELERLKQAANAEGPLAAEPCVGELLEIDREYREKAEAGELAKIAPRRFNPLHEAWLPILHRNESGWKFTALYSNTARAHELGRTHDWVVIHAHDHDRVECQHTVVTETHGPLAGKRVVRGRETECLSYYRRSAEPSRSGAPLRPPGPPAR